MNTDSNPGCLALSAIGGADLHALIDALIAQRLAREAYGWRSANPRPVL